MTETLDRETPMSPEVDLTKAAQTAGDATRPTLDRMRRRAQAMSERAQAMRERGQDLAERAQTLRARAQDFASRAPGQARREIARRRSMTAARLHSLADAIRPDAEARRRNAVVAGGSSVALAAALGLGVVLGFYLSRELNKRARARQASVSHVPGTTTMTAGRPEETQFSAVGGLPH
jgi:hypothetical protein